MAPGFLTRLAESREHLLIEDGIPLFELDQSGEHREKSLSMGGGDGVRRGGLRGVLAEPEEFPGSFDRIVIAAFEGVGAGEVMHVVAVMTVAVELVPLHPAALVDGG